MFHVEPELPTVADEDKVIVRNVLYTAKMCINQNNDIENWSVNVGERGYTVNVYFAGEKDIVVPLSDLQMIQDVNPLRIASVSVTKSAKNPTSIRVFITDKNQPIALSEIDVVRVRKRTRFANIFAS